MARPDDTAYIGAEVDAETKGKLRELAGQRHTSMSALLREQVNILLKEAEMDDDSAETIEA
jgi:predicted transcriptional regulator